MMDNALQGHKLLPNNMSLFADKGMLSGDKVRLLEEEILLLYGGNIVRVRRNNFPLRRERNLQETS